MTIIPVEVVTNALSLLNVIKPKITIAKRTDKIVALVLKFAFIIANIF